MLRAKKSFLSIIMAVFTLVLAWFAVAPQSVEASADTCSSGTRTRVITVVTKANWWLPGSESITLKPTPYKYKNESFYATWNISVYEVEDIGIGSINSHFKDYTMKKKAVKIPLKPNKKYKIYVEYGSGTSLKHRFCKYSTWKVSSAWKATYK